MNLKFHWARQKEAILKWCSQNVLRQRGWKWTRKHLTFSVFVFATGDRTTGSTAKSFQRNGNCKFLDPWRKITSEEPFQIANSSMPVSQLKDRSFTATVCFHYDNPFVGLCKLSPKIKVKLIWTCLNFFTFLSNSKKR